MPTHPFTARWVQAIKPSLQRTEYFDEAFTGLVLRVEPSGRNVPTLNPSLPVTAWPAKQNDDPGRVC